MKKGLLFILLAAGSVCLSAQEKKEKIYSVETNSFGSNWFISGGVGAQVYFGDNDSKADFGKRIAPALDVAVGKWFTPSLGLRLAYNGLQAKGATPNANDVFVKGGQYSNGYYKQKWNLANFHGDVLLNVSNLLCGYKENRVYSLIPYLGAGWLRSWSEPNFDELGVNAGLINKFRLSSALDLDIEMRGVLMKNAFGGKSKEGMAGVTVGLTYKFNKRNWKPSGAVMPSGELDEMRSRINALKSENEELKRDLVAARNKKPEVVVQKEVVNTGVSRLVVLFEIGKSSISKKEYMNIESMAKVIKGGNKTYTVCGYADKGTGSAEYNLKLSKKRAEAVREVLVREFGVSESQLKVEYKGGVDNMFYNDSKLSRVAIVEE